MLNCIKSISRNCHPGKCRVLFTRHLSGIHSSVKINHQVKSGSRTSSSQRAFGALRDDISRGALKWIAYLGLALLLAACHETQYTETYLLEHPMVLESELQSCMAENTKSNDQITRCKTAAAAQDKIRIYIDAQQEDPEKFGQHILDVEMELAKLNDTDPAYQEKQQQLKILLAVAGLNSPE